MEEITLREYFDCQMAAMDDQIKNVRREAQDHVDSLRRERELFTSAQAEAIRKAEVATDKRFDSVNAFRAQLTDIIGGFLPREVNDAQMTEIRKQMNSNTDRLNRMSGWDQGGQFERRRVVSNVNLVFGFLGLLIAILSVTIGVLAS